MHPYDQLVKDMLAWVHEQSTPKCSWCERQFAVSQGFCSQNCCNEQREYERKHGIAADTL